MKRISTNKVRPYVEQGIPFRNHSGSLRGEWATYGYHYTPTEGEPPPKGTRAFIVWTYNTPLIVYDETSNQWFGNEHKYSSTSSKHKSYARPRGVEIQWRDKNTVTEIAQNGLAGAVRKRFREAA